MNLKDAIIWHPFLSKKETIKTGLACFLFKYKISKKYCKI